MKSDWYCIQIALGGVTGRTPNPYGPPGHVETYDKHLSRHFHELREGGFAIDKRAMGLKKLVKVVLTDCFLMDASLPEWTVRRGFMVPERLVKISSVGEIKSGDYIPLHLYAQIWQDRDARVGRRHKNTIIWSDGEVMDIPPPESLVKDSWIQENWSHPDNLV